MFLTKCEIFFIEGAILSLFVILYLMEISIIYPVRSLENDRLVSKALNTYGAIPNIEHIVVTSDSNDKAESDLYQLYYKDTQSRATRLNEGLKKANGKTVILHHPRSLLSDQAIYELMYCNGNYQWGAFTHAFDKEHVGLDFTSWYSNNIRGDMKHIYYLDHCLFSKKDLLEKVGGVPEVDIFEDTLLCEKLRKIAKPLRLSSFSITSAVRFEKNGFWKQSLMNQFLKAKFYMKGDLTSANKMYEKNIDLNSKY